MPPSVNPIRYTCKAIPAEPRIGGVSAGRVKWRSSLMPSELKRVVRLTSFADEERTRPALRYWLSRPPAERVAAVEYLRRQIDGARARLRRVYRILDCPWR